SLPRSRLRSLSTTQWSLPPSWRRGFRIGVSTCVGGGSGASATQWFSLHHYVPALCSFVVVDAVPRSPHSSCSVQSSLLSGPALLAVGPPPAPPPPTHCHPTAPPYAASGRLLLPPAAAPPGPCWSAAVALHFGPARLLCVC